MVWMSGVLGIVSVLLGSVQIQGGVEESLPDRTPAAWRVEHKKAMPTELIFVIDDIRARESDRKKLVAYCKEIMTAEPDAILLASPRVIDAVFGDQSELLTQDLDEDVISERELRWQAHYISPETEVADGEKVPFYGVLFNATSVRACAAVKAVIRSDRVIMPQRQNGEINWDEAYGGLFVRTRYKPEQLGGEINWDEVCGLFKPVDQQERQLIWFAVSLAGSLKREGDPYIGGMPNAMMFDDMQRVVEQTLTRGVVLYSGYTPGPHAEVREWMGRKQLSCPLIVQGCYGLQPKGTLAELLAYAHALRKSSDLSLKQIVREVGQVIVPSHANLVGAILPKDPTLHVLGSSVIIPLGGKGRTVVTPPTGKGTVYLDLKTTYFSDPVDVSACNDFRVLPAPAPTVVAFEELHMRDDVHVLEGFAPHSTGGEIGITELIEQGRVDNNDIPYEDPGLCSDANRVVLIKTLILKGAKSGPDKIFKNVTLQFFPHLRKPVACGFGAGGVMDHYQQILTGAAQRQQQGAGGASSLCLDPGVHRDLVAQMQRGLKPDYMQYRQAATGNYYPKFIQRFEAVKRQGAGARG